MKRIAKFEKVSYEQFKKDLLGCFKHVELSEEDIKNAYDNIKIPKRATKGSAGYDFFANIDINLKTGVPVKIPTGIRVCMEDGWVLKCYPRSGLGFKHRVQLDNTVGIIDSDYYYSDNEGHMFAKLTKDSKGSDAELLHIKVGEAFMQGIFVEYGITEDDEADGIRNGGFGSTTK